uniref:Septum formation inhibitor-activating ATPase n=1 Tax=Klebsiella pneumoniae TaxID=573 RepID=A0A8B0SUW4_KLEPN|nr:Septum formation inhibitor-activating ATPase [Klebsiella pneumoniae]
MKNMSPSYAGDLVMSRATANFEIIVTESEEEFLGHIRCMG